MAEQRMPGSADQRELRRFAGLAGDWWDDAGPMAPLHKLNPVRLAYIRDRVCGHLGRDPKAEACLAGLCVL
ncbi:MAG: bifunctional 2-polyprenyl-6-hydroxyphenol methylase/3-demethylubiquinol 3-O-methyltransferase UbiG, partial [Geminicoccaceae bacterium]